MQVFLCEACQVTNKIMTPKHIKYTSLCFVKLSFYFGKFYKVFTKIPIRAHQYENIEFCVERKSFLAIFC